MTSEVLAHIAVLEAEQPAPQKDDGAGQDSPRCLPETIYRAGLLTGIDQTIGMVFDELPPHVRRIILGWRESVQRWAWDVPVGGYAPPASFAHARTLADCGPPPAPRPLPPRPRDPFADHFASRTGPALPEPVHYVERVGTGIARPAIANLPHTEDSEKP